MGSKLRIKQKQRGYMNKDVVGKQQGEVQGSLTRKEIIFSEVLKRTKQRLGITENARAETINSRCWGLNCVPQNTYVEALTLGTSECDYLETGLERLLN